MFPLLLGAGKGLFSKATVYRVLERAEKTKSADVHRTSDIEIKPNTAGIEG